MVVESPMMRCWPNDANAPAGRAERDSETGRKGSGPIDLNDYPVGLEKINQNNGVWTLSNSPNIS